jgi:methylglutaconyl-CoA hydratase
MKRKRRDAADFGGRSRNFIIPEMRNEMPPAAIMAYLGRYALPKRIFPLLLLAPDFTARHARSALREEVQSVIRQIRALDGDATRQCNA